MKYLLLIMCLVITPAYAGRDHHEHPEPTPRNEYTYTIKP